MPKAVVTDGYTLDEHMPLYLRDRFYKSVYPEQSYHTTDGYGPYDFSTKGLVMYLPLWALGPSEDRTFKTVDAYKHSGRIIGALWTPSTGRWFDKIDDFVEVTTSTATQDIFDGGGTVLAWINPASDGEGDLGRIFDKSAANAGWNFRVLGDDASKVQLAIYYYWSGDNVYWHTTATEVTLNTWSLVGFSYDANLTTNRPLLYVNGVLVAFDEEVPTGTRDSDAARDLIVGNAAGRGETFDGYIGEAWLYNRILPAAELLHMTKIGLWRYG